MFFIPGIELYLIFFFYNKYILLGQKNLKKLIAISSLREPLLTIWGT